MYYKANGLPELTKQLNRAVAETADDWSAQRQSKPVCTNGLDNKNIICGYSLLPSLHI